jgi:hypothetical protein
VLALTIPRGFNGHSVGDDGTVEIESQIADVILQANVLEEVQKRELPNTSAKAPPEAPGTSLAKGPTIPPAKTPTKPPAQSKPDKSPFEDIFVNGKYKVPYSVKAENICVGLISCEEQLEATSEESERSISRRDDGELVKRARTVKAFDDSFTLKAATYYYYCALPAL